MGLCTLRREKEKELLILGVTWIVSSWAVTKEGSYGTLSERSDAVTTWAALLCIYTSRDTSDPVTSYGRNGLGLSWWTIRRYLIPHAADVLARHSLWCLLLKGCDLCATPDVPALILSLLTRLLNDGRAVGRLRTPSSPGEEPPLDACMRHSCFS